MRKNKRVKAVLMFSLLCFTALITSAQSGYQYRAALQKVHSAGFYKISLQPAFIAKSGPGLADVRIEDVKGKEVPYVNGNDIPVSKEEKFEVFPILKTTIKDTGTSIVVENKANRPIEHLWIKVKNTAVIRTMNLTGSDDLEHWFAIEEGLPLSQAGLSNNGESVSSVTFPASNYHYLKLLVNDKNKAPVNFLAAGIYTSPSLQNTYQPILPVKTKQTDSAKTSYIFLQLDDNYEVNKIHLNIKGPKYFKRQVAVYNAGKKIPELINEWELSANTLTDIFLSVKTNKLLLEVYNADNLPLVVSGAQVYQTDEYVVSYLDTGQYYLITGNTKAERPDYDLKTFTDSLRDTIPVITHLAVTRNPAYHLPEVKAKHEYTLFIWAAIIIALVLLSLLTWRMMGEINNMS